MKRKTNKEKVEICPLDCPTVHRRPNLCCVYSEHHEG
jgi:hypothetical protein